MPFRLSNPVDADIAWCIHLHRNQPETCLGHLREHYPGSRIDLIVDGDLENVPRYQAVGARFGARVLPSEPLFKLETGHLFAERVLRQGLDGPEKYFLKIDPDTRIWRRFAWLPGIACSFGTLETMTMAFNDRVRHPPNIQGGCIGFTREVAEGVLASGLLTHERCATQARTGWARNMDCDVVVARGKMHDDFLLSWAVDAAGFPLVQHSEIASYWRNPVQNDDLRYAVTHPHKSMEGGGA